MSSSDKCRECGATIPTGSPSGLCGQCLFGLGLSAPGGPDATGGAGPSASVIEHSPATVTGVAPEGALPHPASSVSDAKPTARPQAGNASTVVIRAVTEKPGDKIGHYKLLQEIGQGGFGVVYMAQQQEPVKRRVALKIVKLGMDTKQVVARFEAERQALALMDHPNIAKMLDAGATDSGRPYFVMELVKGIRITDYCDQNNLSPRERLELFVKICRAVQHAHQKGIIHRDLKPSNILVTLHDGVPVPKIIDFGIAKATQQELTEQTVFTQYGQFIGTPAYMSPEQAEMSGLDVDTRSDIYSLGVLLYELLTGKTPFDPQELMAAGLEAMRRMLREKEPARPSTRLSTLMGEELTLTARHRRVEGPKLVRLVRGDLDWIVMKCLEKDRTRRYESASRFADDIESFLKHEPVSARPPSRLYRVQRMVRRNKLAFAATTAVALSVIVALVASTWMYLREREERRHSQQVVQFLERMLRWAEPQVALGRDTQLLREMLDEMVQQMAKDLGEQPVLRADLCNTIGEVYYAIGYPQRAKPMLDLAVTLQARRAGSRRAVLATSYDNLGSVLREEGELAQAEALERQALELRRLLHAPREVEVARSLNNLAITLREECKLAESETLLRQALEIQRELHGNGSRETITPLNNLALTLREEGKVDAAMKSLDEGLGIMKQFHGGDSPEVALMLGTRAFFLLDEGKLKEAQEQSQQSLGLLRKFFKERADPAVATGLYNLALVEEQQGDLTNAEALHKEALAMRRETVGARNLQVAASLDNLGLVLRKEKRLAEADTLVRDALAMRKKLLGEDHPAVAASLNDLALVLGTNQPAEAEKCFLEALSIQRKRYGTEHPQIATSLDNLGVLLRDQCRFGEAERDIREALTMREKLLGAQHPSVAVARKDLNSVLELERKGGSRPPKSKEARSTQ